MRQRLSRLFDFVLWLYSPPVPAIDIGGALIAAGWCLALTLDPALLDLPSYRSLALLPHEPLIVMVGILAVAHIVAIWRHSIRTVSCLLAGFIWVAAAAGFAAAHAWPAVVTYSVLGVGALLAALYSEMTRQT